MLTFFKKGIGVINCIILLQVFSLDLGAQESGFAPQINNNLTSGYVFSDKLFTRATFSYNDIFNKYVTWNELSLSVDVSYAANNWIDLSAGIYASHINQTSVLSNNELRGIFGIRFHTVFTNRFAAINLSRLELRGLFYSDQQKDFTLRYRNMTLLLFSLNRRSLISDKNIFITSYAEVFVNFDENVRERFFHLFKFKFGLGYRFNFSWRAEIGTAYQSTRQNVGEPSQLPTNFNTDLIFEWRVMYFMSRQKDRKSYKKE